MGSGGHRGGGSHSSHSGGGNSWGSSRGSRFHGSTHRGPGFSGPWYRSSPFLNFGPWGRRDTTIVNVYSNGDSSSTTSRRKWCSFLSFGFSVCFFLLIVYIVWKSTVDAHDIAMDVGETRLFNLQGFWVDKFFVDDSSESIETYIAHKEPLPPVSSPSSNISIEEKHSIGAGRWEEHIFYLNQGSKIEISASSVNSQVIIPGFFSCSFYYFIVITMNT